MFLFTVVHDIVYPYIRVCIYIYTSLHHIILHQQRDADDEYVWRRGGPSFARHAT